MSRDIHVIQFEKGRGASNGQSWRFSKRWEYSRTVSTLCLKTPINTHLPSFRYFNPSNGNSFYQSNELISPEPQPNQQVLSMLQSISVTLSDVQGQLAIIQEQNEQCNSTINRLEGDIKTLKRKNEVPQTDTPKSKRHRKSPCGLSVSANVKYLISYAFM